MIVETSQKVSSSTHQTWWGRRSRVGELQRHFFTYSRCRGARMLHWEVIICHLSSVLIPCCQHMEDPAEKNKLIWNTIHIYPSYWWPREDSGVLMFTNIQDRNCQAALVAIIKPPCVLWCASNEIMYLKAITLHILQLSNQILLSPHASAHLYTDVCLHDDHLVQVGAGKCPHVNTTHWMPSW